MWSRHGVIAPAPGNLPFVFLEALIQKRIQENHRIPLTYDDQVLDTIASRCTEVESGARNVDNILTNTLLPEVGRLLLETIAEGNKPEGIRVGIGSSGAFEYSTHSHASYSAPTPAAEPVTA